MRRQGGVRGRLLHYGEVKFQGRHPPKQVMKVEVKNNVY
jgi:hypothetical protein